MPTELAPSTVGPGPPNGAPNIGFGCAKISLDRTVCCAKSPTLGSFLQVVGYGECVVFCPLAAIGPSGSGKTTLINLLSCLDAPTEGTLTVAGKSVARLSEDELVEVRRGVLGFVFQQFSLLPTLTVAENVELPLMFLGRRTSPQRTAQILKMVGLSDRANHLPRELSGGQMQRVAIARALIVDPEDSGR